MNDAGRVQFIDQSRQGNYLFRGNLPELNDDTQFDYSGLKSRLSAAAECSDIKLPDNYRIIDISLLDPILSPKDTKASLTEAKYFLDNPEQGKYVSWPLLGSFAPPLPNENTPLLAQQKIGSTYTYDNLMERAEKLHRMMKKRDKDGVKNVYYLHCQAGCDRTGMMSMAYKIIKSRNRASLATTMGDYWPVQNGSDISTHSPGCGRNPNYWATSQILWLCYTKVGEFVGGDNWTQNSDAIHRAYISSCLAPIKMENDPELKAYKALPADGMGKLILDAGKI